MFKEHPQKNMCKRRRNINIERGQDGGPPPADKCTTRLAFKLACRPRTENTDGDISQAAIGGLFLEGGI